jgi:dolichol-phosphate mannosyltransferase
MQGTLVIVPTYDEAANIARLVSALCSTLPDAHVLIVDDASPDGTGAIADELARRDGVFVLHRQAKLGLGSAYVAGFTWGLSRAYARFVEMDADFSHDPRYLPELLGALERGADVAVGSRNVPGGAVAGWARWRHLLSKGGSLYSRLILATHVRDMTTGFKAYTRSALELIDMRAVRSNGYAFQIETTYRALQRGLRVVEVPIVFEDRRAGRSKMSRRDVFEAVVGVWSMRLGRRRGSML